MMRFHRPASPLHPPPSTGCPAGFSCHFGSSTFPTLTHDLAAGFFALLLVLIVAFFIFSLVSGLRQSRTIKRARARFRQELGRDPMIDPQQALELVWQERAPASWQVWHATRRTPLAAGRRAFLIMLCVLAVIGSLVIGVFTNLVNGSALLPWFIGTVIGWLGLSLLSGLFVMAATRLDWKDPNPLLIVMPEGFIEYINRTDAIIAIAFAEVSNLKLMVEQHESKRSVTTTIASVSGALTTSTTANTSARLTLVYRGGQEEDWQQQITFGPPETICQAIMTAYRKHAAGTAETSDG